ncbi:universal stress protein [Pedobacter sp. N36a]|uniref:universal stress protein n=1 Tax=Pedobacter sp. N36a TaxID=2767996 RepID=UPI001656AC31|nr:universal stress protein [Pedobacter sp. N36a]MBC8984900.1 universal stress protein [Pedobacter sp. N36a]
MKKILVATDFSVPSENAAHYALAIAQKLKMDILLCSAFKMRTEVQFGKSLVDDQTRDTRDRDLIGKLLADPAYSVIEEEYCPRLAYERAEGNICDVMCSFVQEENVEIIVIGISGTTGISPSFFGSKRKEMMEKSTVPLLLVPDTAGFNSIRKIAFATDLNLEDLSSLQFIINIALLLNAQITIVHITNKGVEPQQNMKRKIDAFFNKVSLCINFSIIKYDYVWNIDIDNGLDWIAEQGNYDMIAITHHKYNFLERMFKGSYTQKLSRHTKIPLLVCAPN